MAWSDHEWMRAPRILPRKLVAWILAQQQGGCHRTHRCGLLLTSSRDILFLLIVMKLFVFRIAMPVISPQPRCSLRKLLTLLGGLGALLIGAMATTVSANDTVPLRQRQLLEPGLLGAAAGGLVGRRRGSLRQRLEKS